MLAAVTTRAVDRLETFARSHFELVYQRRVSDNPEILCKDFCLVRLLFPAREVLAHRPDIALQVHRREPRRPRVQAVHAEAFLILASSSPPATWPARDSAPAAVAGVPLVPSTTFYLVLSPRWLEPDQCIA